MHTSANSSASISTLAEPPQRLIEPLEPNAYERALMDFGLYEKAQRSAMVRNIWEWWKASDTDAWLRPKFTLMLRSDGWKAQNLAEEQENVYHSFVDLIDQTFTILQFRFFARAFAIKTSGHEYNQSIIHSIRKVIDKHLPISLDKIGAMEDKLGRYNRVLKVMYAGAVDAEAHKAIQATLPAGVVLQHHVFNKSAFHEQFLLLLAPDLPRIDRDRAAFEAFLTRMVQIQPHKIPTAFRKRFAYDPKYVYANQPGSDTPPALSDGLSAGVYCDECKKVHRQRIPRSPKTGTYAKFVSVPVAAGTKLSDILPEEWIELPPPE